jgi:hypothetical protein
MVMPKLGVEKLLAWERERLEMRAETVPIPAVFNELCPVLFMLNEFERLEVRCDCKQVLEPCLRGLKVREDKGPERQASWQSIFSSVGIRALYGDIVITVQL